MGHIDIVKSQHPLIDVKCIDKKGRTPLLISCVKGHVEFVKTLLNHPSVDVDFADEYGRTALHIACMSDSSDTDILAQLLQNEWIEVNNMLGTDSICCLEQKT